MTVPRYRKVLDRDLSLLLPPSLDESVSADKPVRVIDVWVSRLDLQKLGFKYT